MNYQKAFLISFASVFCLTTTQIPAKAAAAIPIIPPAQQQERVISCVDSDNGANYTQYGFIKVVTQKGNKVKKQTIYDRSINANFLSEKTCNPPQYEVIHDCRIENMVSRNGACVRLPVNRPPVLDSIGNKQVNENSALIFNITASDPDRNALTYSARDLPAGAVFNQNTKTFSWTPTYEQAGEYRIIFSVSDGRLTDEETITITVQNVNRPPVLREIGNQQIDEDQELRFEIAGEDPDNNPLIYSVEHLPDGAQFDGATRVFVWIPTYEQAGEYTVDFTVGDGDLSDSESVTINVSNVNRAPVLNEIGNREINENEPLEFQVFGEDPDGDALSFSARGLPQGAVFEDQVFRWVPTYEQVGEYQITFRVSDGNLIDEERINITVNNINRLPVLYEIGNKQTDEGQELRFEITGEDPDNNPLIYSVEHLPAGAQFGSSTRVFVWTPTYQQSGSYEITFKVNDGSSEDLETITIMVNNVNRAPILHEIGDRQANALEELNFEISGEDSDGGELIYSAENLPAGAVLEGNIFQWTPARNQDGDHQIIFSVRDDGNLSDSETININVEVRMTAVRGQIFEDATWTLQNSPYLITGNTRVEQGVTLTIEPGVEVWFDGPYYLGALGRLIASGTEEQRIIFTTNPLNPQVTDWAGIRIWDEQNSNAGSSTLRFLRIEKAGTLNGTLHEEPSFAIHLYNSATLVENNEIIGTERRYDGIYISNSGIFYPTIRNNYINNNVSSITIRGGKAIIEDNHFENGTGINCSGGRCTAVIRNNICTRTSISVSQDENSVEPALIEGNQLINAGIKLGHGKIVVRNNQITKNENLALGFDNTGLRIENIDIENIIIENNLISGNEYGVYFVLQGAPHERSSRFGSFDSNTIIDNRIGIYFDRLARIAEDLGIHNNNIINNRDYAVYVQTQGRYDFTNNWWGTTSAEEIEAKIYSFYNEFDHAEVIFELFRTRPVGENMAPVLHEIGNQQVNEGEELSFEVTAEDADGDELEFSVEGLPVGATFENQIFTWTPNYRQAGEYEITFIVADEDFEDSEIIIINVVDAIPPCVTPHDGMKINKDTWFCPGEYFITATMTIEENDITLDCQGAIIRGNGNSRAINLQSTQGVTITNCNIQDYEYGIWLRNNSSNNIIRNNNFNNIGLISIYLRDHCQNNEITGNNLKNGMVEISLDDHSDNNTIRDNTFNASDRAIWIGGASDGNIIYHNNFINNRMNVQDTTPLAWGYNNWNFDNEGNYWSDFDEPAEGCFDSDNNGICDNAYNFIDVGGGEPAFDFFPFIQRNGWLE